MKPLAELGLPPMENTIVYPGTFDPMTHGHVDLVKRASLIFDTVIIAIAASVNKTPTFTLDERVSTIKQIFQFDKQVHIETFSGLLVNFMQQKNIRLMLRGLRTPTDMEYEFQLANMYQCLMPGVETVFLKSNERFAHVSSSMVREIAMLGGDLSAFVPNPVITAFEKLYGT